MSRNNRTTFRLPLTGRRACFLLGHFFRSQDFDSSDLEEPAPSYPRSIRRSPSVNCTPASKSAMQAFTGRLSPAFADALGEGLSLTPRRRWQPTI
jgi:hypothetical protein